MGSSSSKRNTKRVTFDGDAEDYIYETTTTHTRQQPAPVRQTIIERTYTDQDSFELGDPGASRSRESTFSLGQRIKTKAENVRTRTPDHIKVDQIIREHHHVSPQPVTASTEKPVLYRRTTQHHGGVRPGKPTMSDGLWTSRHSYDDDENSWRTSSTSPRLSLHTGRTSHSDSGVTVLDGEVLQATPRHRSHHQTVVQHHRRHRTGSVASSGISSAYGSSVTAAASDPGPYYEPRRYQTRTVRRRIVEVDEPVETVVTQSRRHPVDRVEVEQPVVTQRRHIVDRDRLVEYLRDGPAGGGRRAGDLMLLPSARHPSRTRSYFTAYD